MRWIGIINAGSSSLKYAAFDEDLHPLLRRQVAGAGAKALAQALDDFAAAGLDLSLASGFGHRIVHGGLRFEQPVIVDQDCLRELEGLNHLAPLHMPYGVAALQALRYCANHIPHIACFDTAFHAGRPQLSMLLPLPRVYSERGYRRYGFHGLSYEHVVETLPRQTGQPLPSRLIAVHLGSGCSACAIRDGRSVETTMSYSTLDGLMMGTRSGAIDPGLILSLLRDEGIDAAVLEDLLYRKSGLLGVSGQTADMRRLLEASDAAAMEAVELFCYQAARQIAALAVPLGGVDALAFTGGIGENAPTIRERITRQLRFLDLPDSAVHTVAADEERVIARHVINLIG